MSEGRGSVEPSTPIRIPNRKKQRREYLRRKWMATLGAFTSLAMLSLVVGILIASSWSSYSAFQSYWHVDADSDLPYWSAALAFVTLVTLPFVWLFWGRTRYQVKEVARLSRVPSILAGPIPAEEILVRAAEEPNSGSETLLRASLTEPSMQEKEL